MSKCLSPLNLGTLTLGMMWDGYSWGVLGPDRLPLDLSDYTAESQWRPVRTARNAGPIPPAFSFASHPTPPAVATISFEDGTKPLPPGITFPEYWANRPPSSPSLPILGYPWILVITPTLIPFTVTPGAYLFDVILYPTDPDPSALGPFTVREGSLTLQHPVTRGV